MGETPWGYVDRRLCPCGCEQPISAGSKYADSERCRRRRYDRAHPRLRLTREQWESLYDRMVGHG